MPLDTSIIVNAMLANLPGTPTSDQMNAATNFANAIKTFVEGATITYSTGLVAPSGGGPVTGMFTNTIT